MAIYQLKTFKSWNGRSPRNQWNNTYEFSSENALESAGMSTTVQEFVQFEKEMSHPKVNFMRATVTLIEAAKDGYQPAELRVLDLAGVGEAPYNTEGDPLDLNLALAIKRFGGLGRSGTIYLRGALTEGMVNTDSTGATGLTEAGLILAQAGLDQGITPFMAAGKVPQLIGYVTQGGTKQLFTRDIVSLQILGVVVLKRNHKWFNRGAE